MEEKSYDHVEDSGTRQKFDTGAVRDQQTGKGRYDLVLSLPHMLKRLAGHFENGAVKYGDDNWRKGMPLRRFIDSAFRHLSKFAAGSDEEDHLTAAVWNLMCLGETANRITLGELPAELNDMPFYESGKENEKEIKIDGGCNAALYASTGSDIVCQCKACIIIRRHNKLVQEVREPTVRPIEDTETGRDSNNS